MKKLLSLISTMVLMIGLTNMAIAEPANEWPGEIVQDASLFFAEPRDLVGCICGSDMGVGHMVNRGVTYFAWSGFLDRMPPLVKDTCFGSAKDDPSLKTVVFLDGVPNLSKDLFKYWESVTNDVYIPDSVTEIDEDCFVEDSAITLHFTANNAVALSYAEAHGMKHEIVPEPEEVSDPSTDKVVFDVSVFFENPELEALCGCEDFLGVHHMAKDGVTFFKWADSMDKMPSNGRFCGKPDAWCNTVVFLNGVPNLVKDLFKYWENGTNDVYIPDSVTEIDEDCFVKNSHITIHFTKNNAVALTYAQNRGMAFEVMDGERVANDVNFDKSVDMKDTLALRKSIANLPAAYEIYSLDINADGSADMKDVLTLRKTIAHAAA